MTHTPDPTTRRLGRLAGLCVTGQAAGAELELADWLREPGCPAQARVLLAALLCRRGAAGDARRVLDQTPHDPLELLTLATLLTDDDAARRDAVGRLRGEFAHLPFVRDWLDVVGAAATGPDDVPDCRVEQLAAELLAAVHGRAQGAAVLRTLVVAQQHDPHRQHVALVRRAVTRIAPEFAGSRQLVDVCHALAELALLAGDADDARRWAHRGLKIEPYHAALALVLARIADDAAVGPPAAAVLDRVSRRHPAFADVRAALIRREHDAGDGESARRRLADWLAHEPVSRVARQLHDELERAA